MSASTTATAVTTTAPVTPTLPPALTAVVMPQCGVRFSTILGAAASSCYLPNWGQYLTVGYYSPGICPGGYTPACTASGNPPVQTEAGETAYYCAPIGYFCTATTSSSTFTTTVAEITGYEQLGTFEIQPSKTPDIASLVQIRWQSTDIAKGILPTDPLSVTANTTGTPHYHYRPLLAPNAIAVVVILPLTAIICLAWFCLYGRRRNHMWMVKPPTRPPRDIEMQRLNRWRRGVPVFRPDNGPDPPPAYGVENPVMSPHLTEQQNLARRLEELARQKETLGSPKGYIEEEERRIEERIAELRRGNSPRTPLPRTPSPASTIARSRPPTPPSPPTPPPAALVRRGTGDISPGKETPSGS